MLHQRIDGGKWGPAFTRQGCCGATLSDNFAKEQDLKMLTAIPVFVPLAAKPAIAAGKEKYAACGTLGQRFERHGVTAGKARFRL